MPEASPAGPAESPAAARAAGDRPPAGEVELVTRARNGDRDAFAALYTRFAPAVHGVLLASTGPEDAADLVHEVFLLALRSIERLEDPECFAGWLFTIARNRAKDALKVRARTRTLESEPIVNAPPAHDDEDEAELLLSAVQSLPECYRETLALRLVEGMSGPEIALRTGMTHGSVRVNLFRGMKLLREKLARGKEVDAP